jgi:hypothetical protein
MSDERTCGTGLAEQAALPAKLAELTASLAEVLEEHQRALVLSDAGARFEDEAYTSVARRHRELAVQLESVASQMVGCRDLPAAEHDASVMAGPAAFGAFERFVKVEQELLALLQHSVTEGREMLAAMRP